MGVAPRGVQSMKMYCGQRTSGGGWAVHVVERYGEHTSRRRLALERVRSSAPRTSGDDAAQAELARQVLADALGEKYLQRPDVYRLSQQEVLSTFLEDSWKLTSTAVMLWAIGADRRTTPKRSVVAV